jgi:UDP-galactopyranose mutase
MAWPVLNEKNLRIFKKYETEANKRKNVCFVGRLGRYRYLNMDQVVADSLSKSRKM